MKSLKNILTIVKVFRIICLVLFILAIIGVVGVLLAMLVLALLRNRVIVDNATLQDYLMSQGVTYAQLYLNLGNGLITGGTAIFLTKHIELYLEDIEKNGSPFTREIVKETRKCALVHGIVAISVIVVCLIFTLVMKTLFRSEITSQSTTLPGFGSAIVALVLFILSFFIEYPVELSENLKEKEMDNNEDQLKPEDYIE